MYLYLFIYLASKRSSPNILEEQLHSDGLLIHLARGQCIHHLSFFFLPNTRLYKSNKLSKLASGLTHSNLEDKLKLKKSNASLIGDNQILMT